jgi:teichuronic acid biosynthesis glycosyltransferase TuaC
VRIAIVTTSYPAFAGDPSGHFVAAEARNLATSSHAVTVFAPAPAPAPPPASAPDCSKALHRVDVVALPHAGLLGWPGAEARARARPWRALGAPVFVAAAARALARQGPFDRVIAHWIVPCAWPAALASPAPLEIVAHGSDVRLLAKLPRPLRVAIVGSLLARKARFRFVSRELRRMLADSTGFPELQDSAVEPPALDLTGAPTREAARRALGIAPNARVVAIVSRLLPAKRTAVALNAAALLPNTDVLIAGDGPELVALRRRFPEARFLGRLPRPSALACIAAADVVLSASRDEGAPTVVREARALGVSVVAVASGDLAEWATGDPALLTVGLVRG